MLYYVYIIQSLVDGTFYTGYTKNLVKRLDQHNIAKTGYTARKKPWKIVYTETYDNKSSAISREQFLKRQKNSNFIKNLIA